MHKVHLRYIKEIHDNINFAKKAMKCFNQRSLLLL